MSSQRVEMLIGPAALAFLCEPRFLAAWKIFSGRCPYATGFQSSTFVLAWYETYKTVYQPVVVWSKGQQGELLGLWLLAFNPVRHELVHAGAHQAEYHVWLALPESSTVFLECAWTVLQQQLTFRVLRFKYLPAVLLTDVLRAVPSMKNRLSIRIHPRPLVQLDATEIKESFAKKSNKSRFSRLKKLGALEFRRITNPEEFEQVFADLSAFYDFRQGAVNHTTPFRADPLKRMFCKALLDSASQETHLTVTTLAGRVIAALWGTVSGQVLHLGILAYSPFLSEHSPGKLHIMQLKDYLLKEGLEVLDLTPGGDPWKERFANGHDEVAETILYRSAIERSRTEALTRVLAWGKRSAAKAGIQPAKMRRIAITLRRIKISAVVRKVRHWTRTQREFRVYRADRVLAERFDRDARIMANSLEDMLRFEPGESWQSQSQFLSSALERLERGETVYTLCIEGRLAHYGWMVRNQTEAFMTEVQQSIVLPKGSVALYDYYTHPDFRQRGFYRATIGHMLYEAFTDTKAQYAYISVLADNLPSRHVVETLGFEYQGSLYWKRSFGVESKWADPVFLRKEIPDA